MNIVDAKEKLKKFQELIALLKEVNKAEGVRFYFLKQDGAIRDRGNIFQISDFINIKNIIVVGSKTWQNGPYTNWEYFLMGFLDEELDVVEKIPFSNGWTLENIWYADNGYFSNVRPVLVVKNNIGEEKELRGKSAVDLIKEAQSL